MDIPKSFDLKQVRSPVQNEDGCRREILVKRSEITIDIFFLTLVVAEFIP